MDSKSPEKKQYSKPELEVYGTLSQLAKGDKEGPQPLPKKKYSKPELIVYGKLEDITSSVIGLNGAKDNITGVTKTH